MNRMKKSTVILCIVLLVGGFLLGNVWTKQKYSITGAEGFDELQIAYSRIINNYLEGAEERKLIEGAINGMVSSLGDPYSVYHPTEEGEQYVESYSSNFYGVGAVIKDDNGKFIVDSVYKDMPAEKSGLKPGDAIIAVNGESSEGLTLQKLVAKVKGEKDTEVTIEVLRNNVKLSFTMTRAEIPVYTVESEMLEQNIGYINILNFAEKTDVEFKDALAKLEGEGMESLILDLRSNPGGYVDQARNIADVLVPKDKVIYEVVFKDDKNHMSYVSKQSEPFNKKVVVLVNEYSASASELLTAALKESAGDEVIGTKTFGKGIVQIYQQYKSGSVLVLTEAQWRTPEGAWIHGEGVTPTQEVKLPDYAYYEPMTEQNLQSGNNGEQVTLLKKWLTSLGYKQTETDVYDEEVIKAVKAIQQKAELEVTGAYTKEVGSYIYKQVAEMLEQNDTQLQAAIKEVTK